MVNRQYQACLVLHTALVASAPKDTGNLAHNGIRIIQDNGEWFVIIGGETAPYASATNEAWESEQWKGKQNPNEGWIEKTIENCLPTIRQIMSGTITEQEIEEYSKQYKQKIITDFSEIVAKKEKQLANI